jgi:hypothetical protein
MARTMVVRRTAAVTFALVGLAGAFIAGTGAAADATQGLAVIAGTGNEATQSTFINNTATTGQQSGLEGYALNSAEGIGIMGFGAASGLCGAAGGIVIPYQACTTEFAGDGVYGRGLRNGVSGTTANGAASGVFGQNTDTGYGVAGRADTGTGVLAASTNGTALSVQGTFAAQRSGLVTVATNQIYKQVSITKLSASTFIVATVQGTTAGMWVQRVQMNTAGGYFRIYLNKMATANTKVGWFAIN